MMPKYLLLLVLLVFVGGCTGQTATPEQEGQEFPKTITGFGGIDVLDFDTFSDQDILSMQIQNSGSNPINISAVYITDTLIDVGVRTETSIELVPSETAEVDISVPGDLEREEVFTYQISIEYTTLSAPEIKSNSTGILTSKGE